MKRIKGKISLLLGKTKLIYSIILRLVGEEVLINGVLIKDLDGQFFIESSFKETPLEYWLKQANQKYPLLISITGDGITTKAVEKNKAYLKKLLFNANVESFYIYERDYNSFVTVSFCRKETLDLQYNQIKKEGFNIIHCSLGPGNLISLLDIVKQNKISSQGHCFNFNDSKLFYSQEITDTSEILIGDEKFYAEDILPISNFIAYRNGIPSIESFIDIMNINEKEEFYKRSLTLALPFAGVILILLAFSGHFVRLSLEDKLEVKDSELVFMRQQQDLINGLKKDLEKKEMIYSRSGFRQKYFFIKHISSITNSTSNNIILNQLSLQPLSTKVQSQKVIALKPGLMVINGICSNDSDFKAWISRLDSISWIEKIEIKNYSRDIKNNHFEIEVLLKI